MPLFDEIGIDLTPPRRRVLSLLFLHLSRSSKASKFSLALDRLIGGNKHFFFFFSCLPPAFEELPFSNGCLSHPLVHVLGSPARRIGHTACRSPHPFRLCLPDSGHSTERQDRPLYSSFGFLDASTVFFPPQQCAFFPIPGLLLMTDPPFLTHIYIFVVSFCVELDSSASFPR